MTCSSQHFRWAFLTPLSHPAPPPATRNIQHYPAQKADLQTRVYSARGRRKRRDRPPRRTDIAARRIHHRPPGPALARADAHIDRAQRPR